MTESRPPFPPFDAQTATQKVQAAEDAWNTRDPNRVSLAYTVDSVIADSVGSTQLTSTPNVVLNPSRPASVIRTARLLSRRRIQSSSSSRSSRPRPSAPDR